MKQLVLEEELLRQTGRTTKAVKKALELDAYFVCHKQLFAHELKRDYPELKAVSLSQYLDMDYNRGSSEHFWLGSRPPKVVFDHLVEFVLIEQKLKEVTSIIEQRNVM
jgi:hypothetical protein